MISPRKWSLRTRLLAGLITVTAMFLIIMGVVSLVVLNTLEQDQFSTEISLSAKDTLAQIDHLAIGSRAHVGVADEIRSPLPWQAVMKKRADGLRGGGVEAFNTHWWSSSKWVADGPSSTMSIRAPARPVMWTVISRLPICTWV